MNRYLLSILIVILIAVTFFTSLFIKSGLPSSEDLILKQENQNLRAEIQSLLLSNSSRNTSSSAQGNQNYIKVRVLSAYPFNTKNQITVDAGEFQGVKKSMVVTLGENILVGEVKEVSPDTSVVQTIFDPQFELPVRIGVQEIDSLLQGGSDPKVALIDKTKAVSVGDLVYSAGAGMPYGLKIGEVSEIKESTAGIFKEASLRIPFNVSELREVEIIIK